MKRDGACESLWQSRMPDYKGSLIDLAQNQFFDVVIVGGGIAKPASLPMPKYCVPAVRLVGENVPPATV